MEVFADEFVLVNIVVLLVGAVLGAVTLSNTIPLSVQADIGWVAYWMHNATQSSEATEPRGTMF